jgi:hypothetical protein
MMTPDTEHLDTAVRIGRALRRAGLDVWTASQHQPELPLLMTLAETAHPGYVWLRPHFTAQFAQVSLPVADAEAIISAWAAERDGRVEDPDAAATEGEALDLWERLQHGWEAAA